MRDNADCLRAARFISKAATRHAPESLVQWSRLYDFYLALILVLLNTKYRVRVAESCVSDASSSMADLRQYLIDT